MAKHRTKQKRLSFFWVLDLSEFLFQHSTARYEYDLRMLGWRIKVILITKNSLQLSSTDCTQQCNSCSILINPGDWWDCDKVRWFKSLSKQRQKLSQSQSANKQWPTEELRNLISAAPVWAEMRLSQKTDSVPNCLRKPWRHSCHDNKLNLY